MTATHGGKGSAPRKAQVDAQKFSDNWDLAFGKKKVKEKQDDEKSEKLD